MANRPLIAHALRATLLPASILLSLSACSFTFGGHTFGGTASTESPSASSPKTPPAGGTTGAGFAPEAALGTGKPLGLEPMGQDKSPRSQLMNEGTLGYVLDHLFGGSNPEMSQALLPPSTYGTTTAGGVPGGLWPGNWWIQGQGGGYNLVHLP